MFSFLFLFQALQTHATAFTWDGGGTSDNWSDCVNWVGDACPTASDTVVFDATSNLSAHPNSTIDAGFGSSIGGITLASGYSGTVTQGTAFTIGSGGFTESSATATWTGGASTLTINGIFTLTAGAYTPTSSTWALNGNFVMTGGTMAGTGKTLSLSGSSAEFTYTAGTGNFNVGVMGEVGAAVTMNNSYSLQTIKAGTTLAETMVGVPAVVVEAGASFYTIGDTQLYYLTNNGSYTNGVGYFHAWRNATFDGATNNLDSATGVEVGLNYGPGGALAIGVGDTLTLNPAVTLIKLGANYDNQGTFDITGRTLEFDTGTAGEITHYYGAVSTGDFSALTGGSVSIGKPYNGTFTVLANQTITASTVPGTTPDVVVNALGTLNSVGDVRVHRLTNNGNFVMSTAGYFHAERGVTFDGPTNDLTNATGFEVGIAYNPPEAMTVGSGDTLTLNPAVTVLRIGGAFDNQGTFDISGRELRFDAGFGASEIMHYAGVTNTGDFNAITGATVVLAKGGGSFTVRNGQVVAASETGSNFDLVVDVGGTLNTTGNINVFTLTNNGAFTMVGAGSFASVNGSTLNGTVNDFTNTTTMSVATAYNPAGLFSIGSGKTVLFGGSGITVGGSFTNAGTLTSTAPMTFSTGYGNCTLTTDEAFGGSIIVNKDSGQGVFLAQNTVVNGGVTITAGTLDVTAANYSLTVGGNWSNSATFTPRSGTVTLNGTNQSITGNTTFYNLTKTVATARTLTFAASSTTTISNTLTLQGTVGQRLSLRSSVPTTQANIDPQGTRVLSSLDVQDSNNTNVTLASCVDDCFDAGRNTNWFLSAAVPGVTIVESASSTDVTEGGATDTYTAVLDKLPTADVVVTPTGNADVSVSTALTFTTLNWDTPQTITATAINDSIDETSPENATITHAVTSTDLGYDGLSVASVTAHVTDNDTAGVTVGAISGHTTEALGTATFTVVLDSQPTASVSIGISSDDATEGTVLPASVTFTTGDWATPQTVTVTGVNDAIADGDITYHIVLATASSVDSLYNVINPADVTVINDDNDTAGVTVGAISGHTTEVGGTATFTVVLDTQPTADVSIGVTSDNTAEGTVSASSLTFTSVNWATPQTVTVTGVNDFVDDGNITYHAVLATTSSADLTYNVINPADVTVINDDNDTAGITVGAISGHTTETLGTATFTVVLDTQPTASVSIGISTDDATEGTVLPASLTFTTGDWATPQTVSATGVNDAIDDGNITYHIVLATASSVDSIYNAINPADVTVINDDNDTAGVTVTESAGTTDVSEAGVTDTYEIVLLTEPVSDVTVTPSPDAQVTVDSPSIVFTSLNWNTPRTITVTAVNDTAVEGAHTGVITHAASSVDAVYNLIAVNSVTANITDNDSAGSTGYSPPQNVLHPPSVIIRAPMEAEALSAGQQYVITWDVVGANTNYANLYYSIDGGADYTLIERNALNSGSYSWTIPSINTNRAVVKVAATDLAVEVTSDVSGVFSITLPTQPVPVVPPPVVEPPVLPVHGTSPVNGVQELISPVEVGYYIRSPFYSTVYYVDQGLVRRPFLDVQTFHTYENSFANVRVVTDATLAVLPLGSPMTAKPYTVLVKIFSSSKVYALGPGNTLRYISDEATATHLFGSHWADYVIDLPATFMSELSVGAPMIGDEIIDRSILRRRVDLQ